MRLNTTSGRFLVELGWRELEPAAESRDGASTSSISFSVSFFDSNGFPQDSILYDFIIRGGSSGSNGAIQIFTNQNTNELGAGNHTVTFERPLPSPIHVDVNVKSAGSSPLLLNDRASFEITMIPELPEILLAGTLVTTFATVAIVTRAKFLLKISR